MKYRIVKIDGKIHYSHHTSVGKVGTWYKELFKMSYVYIADFVIQRVDASGLVDRGGVRLELVSNVKEHFFNLVRIEQGQGIERYKQIILASDQNMTSVDQTPDKYNCVCNFKHPSITPCKPDINIPNIRNCY